jgi:hypothetical protein
MAKKLLVVLIALAVVAGAAGAFEVNIGFDPALVSEGDTKGIETSFAPGLSVSADFFPGKGGSFFLGPELGFMLVTLSGGPSDIMALNIPIALRLGWRLGFIKVENLSVYVMGKIGIAPGVWLDDVPTGTENPQSAVFGFNVGGKYFFTPKLGAFLELGYNQYGFRDSGSIIDAYLNSYGRLGVALKF